MRIRKNNSWAEQVSKTERTTLLSEQAVRLILTSRFPFSKLVLGETFQGVLQFSCVNERLDTLLNKMLRMLHKFTFCNGGLLADCKSSFKMQKEETGARGKKRGSTVANSLKTALKLKQAVHQLVKGL